MKPPTFGGSVNPLDADDWLRAILRELEPFNCEDRDKVLLATHQLTGSALAWWENYCAAAKDPSAITWVEFVEEFRRYHIPEATWSVRWMSSVNSARATSPWRSTLTSS
jgi:hypothetical protein